MIEAVSEASLNRQEKFEEEETRYSVTGIALTIFERVNAMKDSLGDVSLLGIISVNWRELPCVMGLAIAAYHCFKAIFFWSLPPLMPIALGTVSAIGMYYIRDALSLRSLNYQINQLRITIADLEVVRLKYLEQGESVEITLKELTAVEKRLHELNVALDQTTKLLSKIEVEYRALNEDHRQLYLKYEALFTSSE
ncbi:MAG TPA: hypothetical protein PKW79_01810 [Rhabdochlamydiaceae bacterium]|nr:hypothetical protein [Rhabdochlamydiaceae bacterium]